MATGYTSVALEKGMDLEQFALLCSRAFGATISMRDEPLDAPLPLEVEPSDYHAKELIKAKAALKEAEDLTVSEREAAGETLKAERLKLLNEWLRKEEAENDYFAKLRAAAKAWTPPTPGHAELKKFMLQQIETSTNDVEYIRREIETATAKSAPAYFAEHLERKRWEVDYHAKGDREETARAAEKTRWLNELRTSFDGAQ